MDIDIAHFVWGEEITLVVHPSRVNDGGRSIYRELVDNGLAKDDRRIAGIEVIDTFASGNVRIALSLHKI